MPNIFQAQDYRDFLGQVLRERSLRNSRYSLRAFGRDLRSAPSLICHLLNGKASLSLEKARMIAGRLALKPEEIEYFVALVDRERSGLEARVLDLRRRYAFEGLESDDWLKGDFTIHDFAVYLKIGLMGTVRCQGQAERHFHCETETLLRTCERLRDLGWLEGDAERGFKAVRGFIRAEPFDRTESVRIFHQKVLEIAQIQLHEVDPRERHFRSFVFSFRREDYEAFCEELAAFCLAKCDAYATRDTHDRIYTLSFQVLPITTLER